MQSITVAVAGFILPLLFGFGLAFSLFELPLREKLLARYC